MQEGQNPTYSLGSSILRIGAGMLVVYLAQYHSDKIHDVTRIKVPRTQQVAPGSVVPSKLEWECKDFNGEGLCQAIGKYDGKEFLFKYDGKKITGAPYEVKPAEVKELDDKDREPGSRF